MFKKLKSKIKKYNSGMTLIELLVVLAIFAIISSITMFDYASFKSSASLNNLANDVSLSIRKAQSYAIGARRGDNGLFTNGYGVYFSKDDNDSFIIFIDKNNDGVYKDSNKTCEENKDDECLEELSINGGDRIDHFGSNCKNDTSTQSDLSISFQRPNLDAYFTPFNSSAEVAIVLKDSKGNKNKFICVSKTGQIRVGNYE